MSSSTLLLASGQVTALAADYTLSHTPSDGILVVLGFAMILTFMTLIMLGRLTPMWYKVIMFAFMIVGLAWLIINYLVGPQIPFMADLGAWNYGIGFGLMIIGLLMTMGWR